MKNWKSIYRILGVCSVVAAYGLSVAAGAENDVRKGCEGMLSSIGGNMITKDEVIKKLDLKPLPPSLKADP